MTQTARAPRRPLILASTSRYRRELLARLHLPFDAASPDTDESVLRGESPETVARRLSLAKARSLARLYPEAVIIGSDQTATLDGQRTVGKPGTLDNARAQLRAAAGKTLRFHSGIAVVCDALGFEAVEVVDTLVRFRELGDEAIERYLALEPALDCAGSAKAEGLGIALMDSFESSDPTAIIGLPLIATARLLRQAGLDPLRGPA